MPEPRPLDEGTLLAERFEIARILGRGGFGVVYLAADLQRNDHVVIKELAPDGTRRDDDDILQLQPDIANRLRQQFLAEARTLAKLSVRGVLPLRTSFTENGTAYYVTDYLPNASTLEKLMLREGRMDVAGALDILYQLLETLEQIHQRGILHRDIKPSNILVSPSGEATLIDFGAAREWHADAVTHHTILFTPGYAPLEQMAERARRGPATDVYSLCATAYEMLTGRKPTPATDRANGALLDPILRLRPDVEVSVASALEAGLALKYADRPQSVEAFRGLLNQIDEPVSKNSLFEYDAKMVRLQRFSFERRQCPSCNGLLEEPRPLRKGICPVCHEGTIKRREINANLCPACKSAIMQKHANVDPMRTCPKCIKGWLTFRKKGLLSKEISARCQVCNETFEGNSHEANGKPWTTWLAESGRSQTVFHCPNCDAQFDQEVDGRRKLILSDRPLKHDQLYPEEWDCVAAGLEPGSGNAECLMCGADYYLDGESITLLGAKDDPLGFAKEHLGRMLTLEDNRWMGMGKLSPHPGLLCHRCQTEFDADGEYLRLVRTRNRKLARYLDRPFKLTDWHRISQDLPTVSEEGEFIDGINQAILHSYEGGELGFDNENRTIWRGPATRTGQEQAGTLTITREEVQFGGVFRKLKLPFDAILNAQSVEDELWLKVSGEPEPTVLKVTPIELTTHLESGRYAVELGAASLASRIRTERVRT